MSDSSWVLQLDPPAGISNRTMLDLNNGAIYLGTNDGSAAIDWGSASITAYETQQGKYGNTLTEFIIPNRTITISLLIGGQGYTTAQEETARSQLQQKVSLLQREGGVLLRQRSGGSAMYADIVNATLTIPDEYGETGGIEPSVVLTLETLPDFYAGEIALDTITVSGTSSYSGVLKLSGQQADIQGDYPARCRLVVNNTSSNNQNGMLVALRSKYESSSTSAGLVFAGTAMTAFNGAVTTGTLSGSFQTHVVELTSSGVQAYVPFLSTTLSSGSTPLSHQGTYRVRARVNSPGFPLQLVWGAGSLATPVTNDSVTPNLVSQWTIVDLGTVQIQPTTDGSATEWFGVIQQYDEVASSVVAVDEVYVVPADECSIQVTSQPPANPGVINSGGHYASTFANNSGAGTAPWVPQDPPDDSYVNGLLSSSTPTEYTEYLYATGFGISIPSAATITGISVAFNGQAVEDVRAQEYTVKLLVAGSQVGSNRSESRSLPSSTSTAPPAAVLEYGGISDLWGTTLTPSQVNASTFGVAFQFYGAALGGGDYGTWMTCAAVGISVHFTFATGLTVAQDAVVYAGESCQLASNGLTRENNTGTINGPVSIQIGDLPRLPPSGLEDRPCRLFVRPSEGDFDATATDTNNGDTFTIQTYYRPSYLSRI